MWILVICLLLVAAFLGFEIFSVVRDIINRKKDKELNGDKKPDESGVDFEK